MGARVAAALFFVFFPTGLALALQLFAVSLGLLNPDIATWGSFDFFITVLIQLACYLGLALFFKINFRTPYFDWQGSFSGKELFYAFLGLIGVNLISGFVMQGFNVEVEQFQGINKELLKAEPFWFIVSVAGLAPIYEEIIFRGFLLRMLLEGVRPAWQGEGEEREEGQADASPKEVGVEERSPWLQSKVILAVLITSLLFSLIHFDLDAAFPIFMLSLYFCAWTLYKRSIYLAIVIHALQNFLASLAFLYGELPTPL